MTKKCPRCSTSYMMAEKHFHKNKRNKDGLSSVCKSCKKDEHIYYKSLQVAVERICKFEECDNVFTLDKRKDQVYCCVRCRDKANKFKYGKQKYYDDKNFKRRFKAKKETENAINGDKGWKEEEINLLFKMRFEKKSFKEISMELKRTSPACWKKYYSESKNRGIPRVNLSKEKYYDK